MKLSKFIKIFHKSQDGGKNSGVTGYWLIEAKGLFSVVLLQFAKGSREAFHSHAFNAFTWWLKGEVREEFVDGTPPKYWKPSFKPKFTPKRNFHRIIAQETSWAFYLRGAWDATWKESINGKEVTLTHGREVIQDE